MRFELSITIRRPPGDVFAFFKDKDKLTRKPGSPVLILEQTTPGPADFSTRYREVVHMLPFIRSEILSVMTRFEPGQHLEEDFEGASMVGHLAYRFVPEDSGTKLTQIEKVSMRGFGRVLEPVMGRMLSRQLRQRLEGNQAVVQRE
jgi:uncharacterized protein YndB with AHSA1/START domain